MEANPRAWAAALRRVTLKAGLYAALFAAPLAFGFMAQAEAAESREEPAFGSNPGNLRMFSYVPDSIDPAAPLIVVLHGCTQKATTFARDAGCGWPLPIERELCCFFQNRKLFRPTFASPHTFQASAILSWDCTGPTIHMAASTGSSRKTTCATVARRFRSGR